LLVDWLEDEYQNKVLAGVDAEAQANGVSLFCLTGGVLLSPYRFGARRNFLYDLAGPACVDGLVLMSGTLSNYVGPSKLARYCERYRPMPMCSIGVALTGIPSVLVDNASGMRQAISHLVADHGYRRIAFIRGPGVNEEAEERYRVYREVLAEHGLPFNPDLVTLGNFQVASGAEAIRAILDERRVGFDAIVAASDSMALGACEALVARGYRIPQDIAVVGFDDIREGRFAPAPLTTVRQPLDRQGKQALELVLAQLEGEVITDHVVLQTELVRRRSCGCSPHDLHGRELPEISGDELTISGVFQEHHARILADVTQAIWASSPDVDVSKGVELVDAFRAELESGAEAQFLDVLELAVNEAADTGGNVDAWQAVITILRSYALPALGRNSASMAKAESLWHEARVLIGGAAERNQAKKRLQAETWARTLRKSGEALFTSLDVAAVMNTVQEQLPKLNIRSAYLSTFEGGQEKAKLMLAYDASGHGGARRGEIFAANQLVPNDVLSDEARQTFIVEPLFFESEQLGFVLFEMGPSDGVVYETLRDQIGSALKAALLVRQLVEETARREMAEREHLLKEVEIAERIQTSILPKQVVVPGIDFAAVMLPSSEVGGDYFDVLPSDGLCWFGVGDVAGHGLRTGLVMMMIQSVVAALVAQNPWTTPKEILRVLNAVIYDNVRTRLGQDEHATLCLLRITRDGHMLFAGAHEDILIYRARSNEVEVVPTSGTWIAAVRHFDADTIDNELRLEPDDVIVLHTDGVTSALDHQQQPFGLEALRRELAQVARQSAEDIKNHLLNVVQRHLSRQQDDITLLVLRVRP
jgi:DNA-binding LacI/PurR family transcriptional regulator/serine phosphatase RsbU (regulator of sigma subunit)